MLFNSIQFAIFLPIVFLLYWFVFDRFINMNSLAFYLPYPFIFKEDGCKGMPNTNSR